MKRGHERDLRGSISTTWLAGWATMAGRVEEVADEGLGAERVVSMR